MMNLIPRALAATVTINPSIPFVSGNSSLPGLINGFYLFALSLAGILAFGAIVYGGIKYAAGRGNPSSESEGKSWITNALLGLLLLGGAYIILQTVNPALTSLTLPGLPHLDAAPLAGFNAPNGQQLSAAALASCGGCPIGGTCTSFGTCVAANGTVYCSAGTSGQCPTGQTCANQGTSISPSWSCVSSNPNDYTCGKPSSNLGTCPPDSPNCVNGAAPGQPPVYYCRT